MGNQQGKLQHQNQSGRPKKAVHWKSAGESELKITRFFTMKIFTIFSQCKTTQHSIFLRQRKK